MDLVVNAVVPVVCARQDHGACGATDGARRIAPFEEHSASISRLRFGVRQTERSAMLAQCCWSDMMCRMFGCFCPCGEAPASRPVPTD